MAVEEAPGAGRVAVVPAVFSRHAAVGDGLRRGRGAALVPVEVSKSVVSVAPTVYCVGIPPLNVGTFERMPAPRTSESSPVRVTPPLRGRVAPVHETELYPPVKAFLEAQGYAVKGEVEGCDLVAVRGDEAPVIVELKTSFTLGLVFQGIARQGVTNEVYLAVPPFSERTTRRKDALALCRRLGLGLLTVRLEPEPLVEALLDPAEFRPRRRKARLGKLLREFQHRVGDPNAGGATRRKVMTAYRQDALRCARYLGLHGPTKASMVADDTGVARARVMMYADHYGWFERPPGAPRGLYALSPKGRAALEEYAEEVSRL